MRRLGEQAFFDMPQQSVQEVIRQLSRSKRGSGLAGADLL
jgi:hypothetical protein